jgi:hypothetical protein
MKQNGPIKIKNQKAFLKALEESKKQNFEDNLKFVKLRAEWLKRASNRDWSRRQKILIDSIYKRNRRLRLKA